MIGSEPIFLQCALPCGEVITIQPAQLRRSSLVILMGCPLVAFRFSIWVNQHFAERDYHALHVCEFGLDAIQ